MFRYRQIRAFVTPLAAALTLAACRSNELPDSAWPPEDFRLRVHALEETDDGAGMHRSFLVWADGLSIYREARRTLDSARLPIPVYRTVAVYRLDERSTRTLCRELDRAGVLQAGDPTEVNRTPFGDTASVAWWAHRDSGFTSRRQLDRGPLDRALEIVDGYLPESRRFTEVELRIRHAEEVPEPLAGVRGALRAHVDVVQDREVDADFLREVFALAIVAGELGIAREALDEIVALGPAGLGVEPVAPADWERFEVQPMRDLLQEAEGG